MRSSGCSLRKSHRRLALVGAALVVAMGLGACASGGGSSAGAAPTVSGAWVRPPQAAGLPAAGYLVITGGSRADALIGVASPIAGMAMLHQTSTDSTGMTGMQEVDRLDIPAGATISLQPGGYHLMFSDLTGTITVGSTVQIVLTFEQAGKVTVQAAVKQG
jgi:copper(I)-binding protein